MKSIRSIFSSRKKDKKDKKTNDPANQQQQPRTYVAPDPWESEAQFEAVKEHMRRKIEQDPERGRMLMRAAAAGAPQPWFEANFPDCGVFAIGQFPKDVEGAEIDVEESMIHVAKGQNGGIRAMGLTVIPPEGASGPTMPRPGEWADTPTMSRARDALLKLLKRMHGVGTLGECTAVIWVGVDMEIWQFTGEKGFFDPPEGLAVVVKKVRLEQESNTSGAGEE